MHVLNCINYYILPIGIFSGTDMIKFWNWFKVIGSFVRKIKEKNTSAEVSWCRIVPVPKCLAFDFVLSSCHYLISVISSISSLVVLNGNFFDVHVEMCAWQIAIYNLHKPNSHYPAFPFRQDPVFSQISISYKKCRQYKHVTCITTSGNKWGVGTVWCCVNSDVQ
jgi:hypothetical protein